MSLVGKPIVRQGLIKDSQLNEVMASVVWIDTDKGRGSGSLVKYDGFTCVLTNWHVLSEEQIAASSGACT